MRDYAGSGSRAKGGGKRPSPRRLGQGRPERERLFKFIGTVSISALLVGVVASLWFGFALRNGLERLETDRRDKSRLQAIYKGLAAERATLMQTERLAIVAGERGLYPPSSQQVRRP